MHSYIPLAILLIIIVITAVRNFLRYNIEIWLLMVLGAILTIAFKSIGVKEAFYSIDFNVIVFLACMFYVGESLYESGLIFRISYRFFNKTKNMDSLILSILFFMGLLSAFFMNDTIAIIGTPLMLYFGRLHKIRSKILLLSLAFSITIGSVMSPIGNPQNLLIAMGGGIKNPFFVFAKYLFIPSMINLILCFFSLKLFFKKDFNQSRNVKHIKEDINDRPLYLITKAAVGILIILIIFKIVSGFFIKNIDISLILIGAVPALFVFVLSRKRLKLAKRVDYKTLLFFVGMFILMRSVFICRKPEFIFNICANLNSIPITLASGVLVSQILSNVPFIALFLPALAGSSDKILMALSAGSTIAGNMFILGAASNVIIIQNAERERETLTFWEFSKIGIPLTIINTIVYWIFLSVF